MFWKRKKAEDAEQLDANTEAEAAASEDNPPKEEEEPKQERSANSSGLSADIERMKAHIDSLKEMRQANSDRFSRISEQIGELRTMIIEQEKRMKDLDFKATKAADLVEEVHPESLMIELKKGDSKIEVLKSKMEGLEAINNNLVAELKNIRRDTTVFRGTESIIKLNEEIMHNLTSIQKVQANIERHSDRVEGIFVEMQKKTAEFQQMRDGIDSAGKSIRAISKELDGTKLQFSNFATKEDYKTTETRVSAKLTEVDKQTESLQEKESSVFQTVDKVVAEKMAEIDAKINAKFPEGDTLNEKLKALENFSDMLKKQIDAAPSLHFDNAIIMLNEKMVELENQKEELEEILANDKIILSNIRDSELKMSEEISANSMAINKIAGMLGMDTTEEFAPPTAPIAKENKGIFPMIRALSKKRTASPPFPPQVAPESTPVPAFTAEQPARAAPPPFPRHPFQEFNENQTATAASAMPAVQEHEMHATKVSQAPPYEKLRVQTPPKKHPATAGSAPQQAKIAATDLKKLMTPEMKQQFIKDIKSKIVSNKYRRTAGTWN